MAILIKLENGQVTDVYASEESEVYVIDFDKHGDPPLIISNFAAEKADEVDINNFLAETREEIDEYNSEG